VCFKKTAGLTEVECNSDTVITYVYDVQKDLTERYVKMNEELKQTKVSVALHCTTIFV